MQGGRKTGFKKRKSQRKKPQKQGKNISLLSGLSLTGAVASIKIQWMIDGAIWEAFLATEFSS